MPLDFVVDELKTALSKYEGYRLIWRPNDYISGKEDSSRLKFCIAKENKKTDSELIFNNNITMDNKTAETIISFLIKKLEE